MTAAGACPSPSAESTFQLGPAQSNQHSTYLKVLTLTHINITAVVFHVPKPNLSRNGVVTEHIFDPNLLIEFVEGEFTSNGTLALMRLPII